MKTLLAFAFFASCLSAQTPVVRLKSGTTPGNGNCMNWGVSGSVYTAGDAGFPCPSSGSGGGGGVVTYSGPTLSILSGTSFCPIGGGGACSATETNVDIDSSAAATVSNMYVQLSQALGAGNSVTVTWRDNAASKTVTCTISGASATACNDTTHSFNVANGDLLDYQLVFSGTIIVTPTVTIMSAFGTSNVGVTSVFGNTGPTVGATGDINATGRVIGINSVPLCTGFTPTSLQFLQYTTASSPNPCYTAAAGGATGALTFLGQGIFTSGTACTTTGTVTVTCAATSITFSSIPGTGTHLLLKVLGRVSDAAAAENLVIQFNADTGSNYWYQLIEGNNTTNSASDSLGLVAVPLISAIPGASATANHAGTADIDLEGYAGTTFDKQVTAKWGFYTSGSHPLTTGQATVDWANTAAITSIKLIDGGGGNFVAGSVFTLYAFQ